MKNFILTSLLISSAFANQCTYNYKQMNSTIKQMKKAAQLNISNITRFSILERYTVNVLLNCEDGTYQYDRAFGIKKKIDKVKAKHGR